MTDAQIRRAGYWLTEQATQDEDALRGCAAIEPRGSKRTESRFGKHSVVQAARVSITSSWPSARSAVSMRPTAVVWRGVEHSAHSFLVYAESLGEGHLGQAAFAKRECERGLGCCAGGDGDVMFSGASRAGDRDALGVVDASRNRLLEGVRASAKASAWSAPEVRHSGRSRNETMSSPVESGRSRAG